MMFKNMYLLFLALLCSASFAGPYSYIKRNGQYYKVKRKVSSQNNSETEFRYRNSDRAEKRFLINAGLSSYESSDNGTQEQQDEERNIGLEVGAAYKVYQGENLSIIPGIYYSAADLSDSHANEPGVQNMKVKSSEFGVNLKLGYDFTINNGLTLRPFIYGGYSSGSGDISGSVYSSDHNDTLNFEGSGDFKRSTFAVGAELEFSNGLAPYLRIESSRYSSDNGIRVNIKGQNTGDQTSFNTGFSEESERTIVLGLGYWF